METERNQQRNQDGRTDRVRDGDSAAKRMEEGRLYFPGDEDILKEQMEGMELVKTIVVKNKLINLILKPKK